eukprot:m.32234 g.32234  ORF g.32234 m.32234 type:complete len:1285 (-) comp42262_c0_seq3:186-4040(-)
MQDRLAREIAERELEEARKEQERLRREQEEETLRLENEERMRLEKEARAAKERKRKELEQQRLVLLQKEQELQSQLRAYEQQSADSAAQAVAAESAQESRAAEAPPPRPPTSAPQIHYRTYPGSPILGTPVRIREWTTTVAEYKAAFYESSKVLSLPDWADSSQAIVKFQRPDFNEIDLTSNPPINRISYSGRYEVLDGLPRYPLGRTGYSGRGTLGRWGPNHCVTPIVTRWAVDTDKNIVKRDGKNVLEVAIISKTFQSGSDLETRTALVSGFLTANEAVPEGMKRIFAEQAFGSLTASQPQLSGIRRDLTTIFKHGQEVFKGIVPDRRNTDNAWIETIAYNFHDSSTTHAFQTIKLRADTDTVTAQWVQVFGKLNLHANHDNILAKVAKLRDAYFGDQMEELALPAPSRPPRQGRSGSSLRSSVPASPTVVAEKPTYSILQSEINLTIAERALKLAEAAVHQVQTREELAPDSNPEAPIRRGSVAMKIKEAEDRARNLQQQSLAAQAIVAQRQEELARAKRDAEKARASALERQRVQAQERDAAAEARAVEQANYVQDALRKEMEMMAQQKSAPKPSQFSGGPTHTLNWREVVEQRRARQEEFKRMLEQDNDSYQNESRRLHEEERKIREAKRQLIEKESKLQAAELSRQRAKPSTNQKDDAGDDIYTYHNSAATAASSEDVDFIDTSANEAEDVYTYHNSARTTALPPRPPKAAAVEPPPRPVRRARFVDDEDISDETLEAEKKQIAEEKAKLEHAEEILTLKRSNTLSRRKANLQEQKEQLLKDRRARFNDVSRATAFSIEDDRDKFDDTTEVFGVFAVKYLGSVPAAKPIGDEVITASISKLIETANNASIVSLSFGAETVLVIKKDAADVYDPKPKDLQLKVPLKAISFSGSDQQGHFCFIARDAKTGGSLGFVFETDLATVELMFSALKKSNERTNMLRLDPFALNRSMPETAGVLTPLFTKFTIPRDQLTAQYVLGAGQFGKVYLADWIDENGKKSAAVKSFRTKALVGEKRNFLAEAQMMIELDSPFVVKGLGVCLTRKPWLLVVEFMPYRDLGFLMIQCRKFALQLRVHELLHLATQLARALNYVAEQRIVHRDVAIRNVLLGPNNVAKLGDFGLSQFLPADLDYWKQDVDSLMPVRYMAPEALRLKRYSEETDVWAFGVALWEMMTCGQIPYDFQGIRTEQVRDYVLEGNRLIAPKLEVIEDVNGMAFDMWEAMEEILAQCWDGEPSKRPMFFELVENLDTLLQSQLKVLPPMRDLGFLVKRLMSAKPEPNVL